MLNRLWMSAIRVDMTVSAQAQTLYDHPAIYDRLMPPGPCEAFYAALAGPGASVLELGCGTGRLAIPLAKDGRRVAAVDASPAMLAAAAAKAGREGVEVEWIEGDMRAFDLRRRFDLVFVSCNSLAHLETDEAVLDCLRAVRRHLKSDGRFAFDVTNPDPKLLARPAKERIKRAPAGAGLRLRELAEYDPDRRVRAARWRVLDPSGAERIVRLDFRQFFPDEPPRLLETAGLTLIERYGDFERRPFLTRSKLQVCIAAAA